ncbi:MAG: hypothetical protein KF887_01570 [Paracoccaceae bacterium]|nr:MAG: hypothetical protein KF887_01570 [Paracoccaceae bacterium]
MKSLRLSAFAAAIILATGAVLPAHAGKGPIPVETSVTTAKTTTKAFVGLNWTFGAKKGPELVLGVASGKAKPSGNVTGGRASVHVGLGGGSPVFNGVKLTAFAGGSDLQGEVGVGFGGAGGGAFGVVGVMGPHANAGVDIYFDRRVSPYIGINTLGKFKPTTTTTTTFPEDEEDPGDLEVTSVGLE